MPAARGPSFRLTTESSHPQASHSPTQASHSLTQASHSPTQALAFLILSLSKVLEQPRRSRPWVPLPAPACPLPPASRTRALWPGQPHSHHCCCCSQVRKGTAWGRGERCDGDCRDSRPWSKGLCVQRASCGARPGMALTHSLVLQDNGYYQTLSNFTKWQGRHSL